MSPQPVPAQRRLFRIEVSTLIVGMVIAQALLLLGLSYWGARHLLYTVGHAAHEEEHARLETDVRAFMGSAAGAVRALAGAPQHSNEPHGEDRSAELVWSLMSESRALDSLYFVDHDGNVIGVQRYPQPGLRRVHAVKGGFTEVLESKPGLEQLAWDAARRYATQGTEQRAGSDVRARPWFRHALESGKPVWTEPHELAFSGERGVTFAAPDGLVDSKGQIDGVAAGDISLRHLSGFVESFSHAGTGDSAILAADGTVLARSDTTGGAPAAAPGGAGDILDSVLPALGAAPANAPPITHGGQVFLIRGSAIPGTHWRLVSWLPEEAVVGGLRRGLMAAAAVLALCLASALGASLWLSRRVTGPVEVLAGVARRIGRLELDGLPRVDSTVEEIHRLDQALDDSARSLRAFRKFVPADVVNELVRQGQPLEPGGQLMELTVMFTDIEGFTGISAAVPPGVLVPQLTEYFNLAAAVVVSHGGTIDKYIGDALMVLWGAPAPLEDAAVHACRAALELQAALDAMNLQWAARGLRPLPTRIGIHTGTAVVGVLGSSERLAFTAFGDTVNVASRVEGLNKDYGTRILATGHTVAALGGRIATRALGEAEIRGRGRLAVFEVTGEPPTTAS